MLVSHLPALNRAQERSPSIPLGTHPRVETWSRGTVTQAHEYSRHDLGSQLDAYSERHRAVLRF